MDNEKLYNLKLHEFVTISEVLEVQRVPSGWNYIYKIGHTGAAINFVPYSDEFKPKAPKQKELFPEETPKEFNFKKALIELGVEANIVSDWLKVRSKKKAVNTKIAFDAIKKQILLTTQKPNDCIKKAVEKSWSGFESEWYFNETKSINEPTQKLAGKF